MNDNYIQLCEKHFKNRITAQRRRIRHSNERRDNSYFAKQRLLGVLLLLFTIVSTYILEGDLTIAILGLPLGLMCIFSDEQILCIDGMEVNDD